MLFRSCATKGGTAGSTCTTCANGSVAKNRVENVQVGSGYRIAASGAGLAVDRNRANDTDGAGLDTTGSTGLVVARNRVDDAGTTTEPCVQLVADASTVSRNKVRRCAGQGFFLDGTGNTVERNTAQDAGSDGFEVGPTPANTILSRNSARSNGTYGFEVADGATPATNTTLDRNKASKNSLFDLCDEGIATTLASNNFKTAAPVVQDGTRDCVQ